MNIDRRFSGINTKDVCSFMCAEITVQEHLFNNSETISLHHCPDLIDFFGQALAHTQSMKIVKILQLMYTILRY